MKNWAGNHRYRARQIRRPSTVDELQEIVRGATNARALGSRHSFNDIADTAGDLILLDGMPRMVEIDPDGRTVTVDGGIRYWDLCDRLEAEALALHSLASLPHIAVAGACATATHGSGDTNGNLSTAVAAMSVVRADGEIVGFSAADVGAPLDGAAVSLGALGVVVDVTLRVEPTYQMRQRVFEDLPLDAFVTRFEEIASMGYAVSFFTEWRGPMFDQVWLKDRMDTPTSAVAPADLFGATPARSHRHPIRGLSAEACTPQLGIPGPWHERLPHFRAGHTPSSGHELQSEYFVDRRHAVDAFLALDRLRARIAPVIQVSEIRTVAADTLWLSPAYLRHSVAFHFTWQPDWDAVRPVLAEVETALARFDPRPHWGKLFTLTAEQVRSSFVQLPAFLELASRSDPTGKFRNDYLRRYLLP